MLMFGALLMICLYIALKCYYTSVVSFLLNGFITLLHRVLCDKYKSNTFHKLGTVAWMLRSAKHDCYDRDYLSQVFLNFPNNQWVIICAKLFWKCFSGLEIIMLQSNWRVRAKKVQLYISKEALGPILLPTLKMVFLQNNT